jgi:DNA-binding GntR family transcriptional regulator
MNEPNSRKKVPASPQLSSADQVAEEVVRRLYSGQYVAGQKLIEADLVEELQVSRGTIREALRRLNAEGVVSLMLHRGAYIRAFSKNDVQNILDVIEVLLGLAARTAAKNVRSAREKKQLEGYLRAVLEPQKDYYEVVRVQNAFYRFLIARSENEELERVLPSLNFHFLRPAYLVHSPRVFPERLKEFDLIGSAVLSGDIKRSEQAARNHVAAIARSLNELPDEAFSGSKGIAK